MSLERTFTLPESITTTLAGPLHIISATKYLVATHDDNTNCLIWYYNLSLSSEPFALRGHTHAVWSLATDSDYLLSGAHDKVILWDLSTKTLVREYLYPASTAYGVLFWDQRTVVSGHFDTLVRVWDRETAVCRRLLAGHGRGVNDLKRYKGFLLSGAENVRMWDVEAGTCLYVFETDSTWVSVVDVKGDMLAVACLDWTTKVWNLESKELVSEMFGHSARIGDELMISSRIDGGIGIWRKDPVEMTRYYPPNEIQGMKYPIEHGKFVGGVISLRLFGDMITSLSGRGFMVTKREYLPHVVTLGLPHRHTWAATISGGKAYLLLRIDGRVCLEIWNLYGFDKAMIPSKER
ncbi:WD40 repeat-like protein [Microthyrium microscopicum]|uniref:WD40 repeat-like protein n=1 Tax=Microthyrium microscopicum TaxID=703497 RepID=A0A6A6U3Y9_9PEZI|nr:WD40 repeat-like protein [Microthyrium microscopicum]